MFKYSDFKIEKMRYQTNNISYILALFAALSNSIYFLIVLNHMELTIHIGYKIMFNIFFLLILFLSMEKMKFYSISYSMVVIALSFITLIRIFVKNNIVKVGDTLNSSLTMILIFTTLLLLVSGINSLTRSVSLKKYLNKNSQTTR